LRAAAGSNGYFAAPVSGKGGNAPFPWDAVLHAGLCLLRLPPSVFWALTPRELFIMTGGFRPRTTSLGRSALSALMQDFPDR
jgi:uncharacterized phage protein (TIGR02216 family)